MAHMKIDGAGKSILVIDDDLAIRVLLQAVLKRMSFAVDLAEDGEVGLDKIAARPYDLILLDLMMPKLNGYEFIDQIARRFDSTNAPHIVVFTAAGQRGIDKIPLNSICNSILKPFDLEKFLEMVTECIDGRHVPRHAQKATERMQSQSQVGK